MLSELVEKKPLQIESVGDENPPSVRFARDLRELGDALEDSLLGRILYDYRGKLVEVRGIPEDFKILYDGHLVCEVVFDNVYNQDEELITLLCE